MALASEQRFAAECALRKLERLHPGLKSDLLPVEVECNDARDVFKID